MSGKYRVAIVGATGAVGVEFLRLLEGRNFPITELHLLASARSAGKTMLFEGRSVAVKELTETSFHGIDIAFFSAGGGISKKFGPIAAQAGALVVDNSSAFRMDPTVPLVIPEINPEACAEHRGIIANPNCSTIIAIVPLWPIHRRNRIRRLIASTYQAASGAGAAAMEELAESTRAYLENRPYQNTVLPHPYAFNLFSHNSKMDPETGYNEEEIKMMKETKKIFGDPDIRISATCVRVPVLRAHSEALTIECERAITPAEVREILATAPGVKLVDDLDNNYYPMPKDASGQGDVLVGRIRQDSSDPSGKSIAMFVAGDQLLKGAALNAVQIAEVAVERGLLADAPMIVMKFGGTSVESAQAIERVAGIVRDRLARRPVVVVSAMGKTTNKLLAIAGMALEGRRDQALALLEELRAFHLSEAAGLGVEEQVCAQFQELAELVTGIAVMNEMTPRATDAVSAFGERLSSIIVTARFRQLGIDAAHLDARSVIVTDARHTQAAPIFAEAYRRLAASVPAMAAKQVVVMGGFIAATEDGVTTTLGRGGSDYTASIVGAGIGAEEIQIWTDVDGMLTSDPTILPGGYRVKQCSFAEAAELAYFGAKVLHPATVLPAIEKSIPVRILNSRRPQVEGTLITAEAPRSTSPIRSIACKRNITLVNIVSTRMLMAHGFLRRIFEIFDRYETPVDMLATSEVSVSLTIDNTRALAAIRKEIEEFAEVGVEEDQAIVSMVGDNIRHTRGVTSRAFVALKDINVRMISQGASLLNISVVVAAADLKSAVESLHREFFTEPDPASFEMTPQEMTLAK